MPSTWWLGRVSSLLDRYRNEEMQEHFGTISSPFNTPMSSLFGTPGMNADQRRIERVFVQLQAFCVNQEAIQSLADFALAYRKREEVEGILERGEKVEKKEEEKGGKEKRGMFERLGRGIMRKRKSKG